MRILFWCERFFPLVGGVEVLTGGLAMALQARGHAVLMVARSDDLELPEHAWYEGVPIRRLPFWAALAAGSAEQVLAMRARVRDLKRSFAPDVVHLHTMEISLFFHLQSAATPRVPVLHTLHGIPAAAATAPGSVLGQSLRAADWVTAVSQPVLNETRRLLPALTARSSLIRNALSPPARVPRPLPPAPRLLCLGRLERVKGFDLALAAFAELLAAHPAARLIVAGEGRERRALEAQAAALHLGRAVEFTGWIAPDAVPDLLDTVTAVVMPSRDEPFGLVALQAAQMARPIIAARVGGLAEVVVDGVTGLHVAPDDAAALRRALQWLLGHPAAAAEMGAAARRRALAEFLWEPCVDAYEGLYVRLHEEGMDARPA